MPLQEIAPVEGVTGTRLKVARGDYSFAVDGGAQSTIALMGATLIPSGAIVVAGYLEVTTQCAGVGASIAVQVEGAGDIVATTVIGSWTAGRKNVLPSFTSGSITAATMVKTTAARDISVVISGADLTAGVFKVVLFYHDPQSP
jgi:hypothetical protein